MPPTFQAVTGGVCKAQVQFHRDMMIRDYWQLSGLGPDQKKRVMIVRQIQRQFPDGTTMIYQLSVLQSNLNEKNTQEHTEQHQMFLNQFRPF